MSGKKAFFISALILVAGGFLIALIFNTEPTAQKTGATKQTAMLVDVKEIEKGAYRPSFQAVGTVMPSQEITLSPRVGGQIIARSPDFTPGGFVEKGDTLLQIDPQDYQFTLEQRRSELDQAIADMNIEMGLQDVSRKEYQLYDTTDLQSQPLTPEQKKLFLREPQLQSAKSSVDLARAAVKLAELQLKRTTITAPFDAQILSRNVNVGSQVAPGDNLARLVGIDSYWVEVSIPLSQLRWITVPDQKVNQGVEVRIRNRTAWPAGQYRTGHLYKVVGSLENQTRMARLLVEIPDPLALEKDQSEKPPLLIGAFVEVQVPGNRLQNTIRLERQYIRNNNTVWIMKDNKLEIRNVDIAVRDEKFVYIRNGLEAGTQVVTTDLSTISEGVPLRLNSSTSERDTTQNALTRVNE